ncbi:MAG: hypothetical protein ABJE66_13900 [Deltaproteobacteria bacterium]
MLRRVFVIGLMTACHPAPAPTVVHSPAPASAAPITQTSPVRHDFDPVGVISYSPLAETIVTGHGPCETEAPRGPILFVATQVEPCKKLIVRRGM